jgi:hypothetical protein
MPNLTALLVNATLTASLLYTATIATAALTALTARTPTRRRDARRVLALLLGRRPRP